MLGLVVIAIGAIVLFRLLGGAPQLRMRKQVEGEAAAQKITELTEYASGLRATKKYAAAEKVYLEILKIDHKHVPTYSRMGTLYSLQRNFGDAIECFTVACQLEPTGATYYNLGLAYYENQNFIKAITAFEKAIMFEPTLQRYIGLAKAYQKVGDDGKMISALEQAMSIEATPRVLGLLADAYASSGRAEEAEKVRARIAELNAPKGRSNSRSGGAARS